MNDHGPRLLHCCWFLDRGRGVDGCDHRVAGILTIQMPSWRPVSACGFSLLSVSGARFGTRYEIRIAPQKRGDGHPEMKPRYRLPREFFGRSATRQAVFCGRLRVADHKFIGDDDSRTRADFVQKQR